MFACVAHLILAAAAAQIPDLPDHWTARRLPDVHVAWGHELRNPDRWPVEPPEPEGPIDEERFADAMAGLCGRAKTRALAAPTLEAAEAASVDPFLLAALAFDQSGCDRRLWTRAGYGVLRLHPAMYFRPGNPPAAVNRADLAPARLLDPRHSLLVGARLLRAWQEQHAAVDGRFRGARHRAAVSHFVWGDVVASSAAEDRILTARRRLLEDYGGAPPEARPTALGIDVVSPLEGVPRVATSGPGEDREGGARRHRGLDITAAVGEPVRSVADGVVTFAGVDLPGASSHEEVSPHASARWRSRETGPGGLFVCVQHSATVSTCYFHLRSFRVQRDQRVAAGEVIGEVGLSGVRTSLPHLHFELHVADRATNPARLLGDLIIPPRETLAYRNAIANQRARLAASGMASGHRSLVR